MRILAVDDDPVILDLLQSPMWLGADHDLVCVDSAAAALTAIAVSTAPFDAFLLDIVMPERDGIDLCAAIRALPDHASTPIIMITASRDVDMMQRAFSAGATDFVSKPLDGLELGTRINMAGLLNDSIRREKTARAALDNMQIRSALGFDNPTNLPKVDGPVRYLALENNLLSLPKGCHALSLFAVRVAPFAVAISDPDDTELVSKLHLIGQSITRVLATQPTQIAYIGRGIFVGVTLGRRREPLNLLENTANAALSRHWSEAGMADSAPALTCQSLSSMGVWAGRAAAEALRDFISQHVRDVDPTTDAVAALLTEIEA